MPILQSLDFRDAMIGLQQNNMFSNHNSNSNINHGGVGMVVDDNCFDNLNTDWCMDVVDTVGLMKDFELPSQGWGTVNAPLSSAATTTTTSITTKSPFSTQHQQQYQQQHHQHQQQHHHHQSLPQPFDLPSSHVSLHQPHYHHSHNDVGGGVVQCEGDMCSIYHSHDHDQHHRWDDNPVPSELWLVSATNPEMSPRKCLSTAEAAHLVGGTEVSVILALQSGEKLNGFQVTDHIPRESQKRTRRASMSSLASPPSLLLSHHTISQMRKRSSSSSSSSTPTNSIYKSSMSTSTSTPSSSYVSLLVPPPSKSIRVPGARKSSFSVPGTSSPPNVKVASKSGGGSVVCSCGKTFSNGQALGGHRKYCTVPRWKPRGKASKLEANMKKLSSQSFIKLSQDSSVFPKRDSNSPPRA